MENASAIVKAVAYQAGLKQISQIKKGSSPVANPEEEPINNTEER